MFTVRAPARDCVRGVEWSHSGVSRDRVVYRLVPSTR